MEVNSLPISIPIPNIHREGKMFKREEKSSSDTAVCDLHGVINLDALSSFFSQLTQQINQQNQTIAQLQASINSLVKIVDFEDSMRKMNLALQSLDNRVSIAQEAATSRIKEDKYYFAL